MIHANERLERHAPPAPGPPPDPGRSRGLKRADLVKLFRPIGALEFVMAAHSAREILIK